MLRRKRFWLGLVISVVFLAIFVARTDFGKIYDSFGEANYYLALSAVPLYFVGFWIRTIRWKILLRPVRDVPVLRLYPVVLIGLMANNVAPARIGELVRAYLVGERESISKSAALGTIAVDRALDGLTLVMMLGIVTAFSSSADDVVRRLGIGTAVVFLAAASVLVALAFSPTRGRAVLLAIIRKLPARLAVRIEDLLDAFLSGLLALRSPLVMLTAASLSVASWLVEGFMYWVVGEAFGLNVGFDVYLLVLAGANLALSIFASPGGVGPFEATTQAVLLSFSVDEGLAGAYAIVLHILLLGPVILAGFSLLWASHQSLGRLMGIPDEAAPPGGITPATGVE